MDATELEDLVAVLADAGWQRVATRYVQQWGPSGERYLTAVNDAMNRIDDQEQRRGLERVRYAQQVMAEFMAWPAERVRQLQAQQSQPASRAELNLRLREQDKALAGSPRGGV